MLICINHRNGSLAAIQASGGFLVNLLKADAGRLSAVFASAAEDKFTDVDWQPSPVCGLPWLHADAVAYVDCRLVADVRASTHDILIGMVADAQASAPGSDVPEQPSISPLVYWRHSYGSWSPSADRQGGGAVPDHNGAEAVAQPRGAGERSEGHLMGGGVPVAQAGRPARNGELTASGKPAAGGATDPAHVVPGVTAPGSSAEPRQQ